MLVCLSIGAIILCPVLKTIVTTMRRAQASTQNTARLFTALCRTVAFQLLILFFIVEVVSYRVSITVNLDTYNLAAFNWVTCLATNWGDFDLCGERPSGAAPFGTWMFTLLATSAQGFFTTIVYASQTNNFMLWINLFKSWRKGSTGGSMHSTSSTSPARDNPSRDNPSRRKSSHFISQSPQQQQSLQQRSSVVDQPIELAPTDVGAAESEFTSIAP